MGGGGRVARVPMNDTPTNGDDGAREGAERCANCGARIAVDEWHPLDTDRSAGGDLVLVPFCTEACREAWSCD